jgi:hypothetical protein
VLNKPEPPALLADAQHVLDELWSKGQLPFPLKVSQITPQPADDPCKYSIQFDDSRMDSVDVLFTEGEEFRVLFRVTVLARAAKLSST